MIVVRVELWPGGRKAEARLLGTATITNDGTGTPELGNYDVALSHSGRYVGRPGAWKRGRVERHPRERLSPYHLVLRALEAALGVRPRKAAADEAPLFGDPT